MSHRSRVPEPQHIEEHDTCGRFTRSWSHVVSWKELFTKGQQRGQDLVRGGAVSKDLGSDGNMISNTWEFEDRAEMRVPQSKLHTLSSIKSTPCTPRFITAFFYFPQINQDYLRFMLHPLTRGLWYYINTKSPLKSSYIPGCRRLAAVGCKAQKCLTMGSLIIHLRINHK